MMTHKFETSFIAKLLSNNRNNNCFLVGNKKKNRIEVHVNRMVLNLCKHVSMTFYYLENNFIASKLRSLIT